MINVRPSEGASPFLPGFDPDTMPPPVLKTETSKLLNMRDTAAYCGVSVGTLRNYIARFPDLPVEAKGVGRAGWWFDIAKVDEWRGKTGLLNQNPTGYGVDTIRRKEKHSERRAHLQADLLQIKLKRELGGLVDREAIVSDLSQKFALFAKRLDMLPTIIGKKLGLAPEVIEALRDGLDEARLALMKDDDGYFAEGDADGDA